jgi:hypothetical protein
MKIGETSMPNASRPKPGGSSHKVSRSAAKPELGGGFEPVFSRFYRASIGWDGADPVRPFI